MFIIYMILVSKGSAAHDTIRRNQIPVLVRRTMHLFIRKERAYMDRRSLVELTNLCLVYQDDKILVQEKVTENEIGIIFPGGHIEEGESLRDSVIREVYEETGLTIEHPIPCGFKDWINDDNTRYIVMLYKTNRFSGELRSSEEGRVFWVKREELAHMNVMWDTMELLQILYSEEYSELFFARGEEGGTLLG